MESKVTKIDNRVWTDYEPSLYLPFNNSIEDETDKHVVINNSNNVILSPSVKKIGDYSAYFNGSDAYLTIADSDDWDLGNNDFTVDLYARLSKLPSSGWFMSIISHFYTSSGEFGWAFGIYNDSGQYKLALWFSTNGTSTLNRLSDDISSSISIGSTWYHMSLVRDGTFLYFYLDGSDIGSHSDMSGVTFYNPIQPLLVGKWGNSSPDNIFGGYLGNVRITKGYARWTTTFTPPETIEDYYTEDQNQFGSISSKLISISKQKEMIIL